MLGSALLHILANNYQPLMRALCAKSNMANILRVALTYQEEIILEVNDDYQSYWISLEQYQKDSNLYKVEYQIEQQIKYMENAKKKAFISKPEKEETTHGRWY